MAVYTKFNQNKINEILSNYNLGELNNFKGTETFGKILKSSSQNPSIIITPTEVN